MDIVDKLMRGSILLFYSTDFVWYAEEVWYFTSLISETVIKYYVRSASGLVVIPYLRHHVIVQLFCTTLAVIPPIPRGVMIKYLLWGY
ncbi:hypothetical protein [Staphylococcus phage vB_SauH_DELF3]|nr:hypothetical protein [Staphylococcus phage vB_SauH_DELF3]